MELAGLTTDSGLILRTLESQHELIYDLKDNLRCQMENAIGSKEEAGRSEKMMAQAWIPVVIMQTCGQTQDRVTS